MMYTIFLGKIVRAIIIRIHSSFCVLKCTLIACRINFATVAHTTHTTELACYRANVFGIPVSEWSIVTWTWYIIRTFIFCTK